MNKDNFKVKFVKIGKMRNFYLKVLIGEVAEKQLKFGISFGNF